MKLGLKSLKAELYPDFFYDYIDEHCKRWVALPLHTNKEQLITEIKDQSQHNARCEYLLYVLWLCHDYQTYYKENGLESYINKSIYMLHVMKNNLLYNDYNAHRFIEIMFERFKIKHIPHVPYEDVFDELQNFIFQYIIMFKRHYNLPISHDFRENHY